MLGTLGSFGRRQTPVSGLLLGLALAAGACGGSSASSQAASPAASAAQRVAGSWRLVSFQPSLVFEEPLRGLLDAQLKQLVVEFGDGEYTASGPGVTTSGRFEIKSAEGDSLSARVYDRAGAGYNVSGTFVGQQLQFVSEDAPWSGRGVLERGRGNE